MDAAFSALLQEERKQREFFNIVDRSHQENGNAADPVEMRDEIIKVGICEAQTVKGLVETMWNKALEDPAAAKALAETCQLMPSKFDPVETRTALKEKGAGSRGSSEKQIDFRLMLIKKSKEELEKGLAARKEWKQWEEKEGKSKLKGEDKENALVCKSACGRMLHAVNFCGFLYKAGILTDKVIHSYVESLLKEAEADPRTEDVEALSSLLALIGSKLDATSRGSRDGKMVDAWYVRIQKIKEDAASASISKIMNGILALRSEGWHEEDRSIAAV